MTAIGRRRYCSSLAALSTAQTQAGWPGRPLAGLTPVEFEEFRLGLDDFLEVEAAEEGLGPAFNGTSCAACHNVPAVGGGGVMAELRAGRRNARRRVRDVRLDRRDALSPVLGPRRTAASRCSRRMRPCSRDAFRSRSSAPGSSKPFPTRRCGASRIRTIATATASAGARRSSSMSPPAIAASAASAGRRSTPRC